MKIYVNLRQEATINPLDVIDKLKEDALGDRRDWFFERDGKYYHGFENGGGSHSWDDEKEITKELYNYLVSLDSVKKYLEKKVK